MTLVPASMLSASDLDYLGPTVTDAVRSQRSGRSLDGPHHRDLVPAVRRSLASVGEATDDESAVIDQCDAAA
ncbi:MAG: hypothetical protein GC164_16105 [Phycisphaera sp.]|nr:hypothetical protein [Phycisphaera sp.]